ncbi:MAG: exodeoxyribonuclease VII large subunit [Cyclobacteriaceae bacterium]
MSHLTLFELVHQVKTTLDNNLDDSYWVIAEIGEMRVNQKGHCYLELVEKEGAYLTAKLRANIWSSTYRNLSAWFVSVTSQKLKAGMKILAQVSVQYHEVYGLSLLVTDLDPNFTLGERARRKQEVIRRLHDEGVIDLNKELALPLVPQRVAVISAPTAAGYGDFVDQLANNPAGYSFTYKLFKAVMQGDEAEASIINAFEKVYKRISEYDLVVLLRGGGSQVDLDCFDSYTLARALAQFPLPVVTGIGHERDETIVDLVAHTKTKTPTAAAAFLVSCFQAFDERLGLLESQLESLLLDQISQEQKDLQLVGQRLRMATKNITWQVQGKMEELRQKMIFASHKSFETEQQKCNEYNRYFKNKSASELQYAEQNLDHLEKAIQLLSPRNILKRGYTLTYFNGKLLKDKTRIGHGDVLQTKTLTKTIISKVEDIK